MIYVSTTALFVPGTKLCHAEAENARKKLSQISGLIVSMLLTGHEQSLVADRVTEK